MIHTMPRMLLSRLVLSHLLIVGLALAGCDNGKAQRERILVVTKKVDAIYKSADTKVHENPQDIESIVRSMSEQLQNLDLTDCPQDFRDALIDERAAVDSLALRVSVMPKGFLAQLNTATEDVVAGRSYDSTISQSRREATEALEHLHDSHVKLQKVAARYNVTLE